MTQHKTFTTTGYDPVTMNKKWFLHCYCEGDDCGYQSGPFDTEDEAERDGDEHTLAMANAE